MPSTPSSKSSTSTETDPLRRAYVARCIESEDYKSLLLDLLAVIHRDGGHYTHLVGLQASFEDAENKVMRTYHDIASMKRKLGSMMFGTRKP